MKQAIRAFMIFMTVWTVCLSLGGTVLSVFALEEEYQLAESPDAGAEYQDALIFLGESTTAHLKSRGVLSGGKRTAQVWADESGTMRLGAKIATQTIIYPPTGEKLTIAEAVALEKPAYMVLSFGLNGIVGFFEKPETYERYYQSLIDIIQNASPQTAIILQTVYPVTSPKKPSDWHFSHSPERVNEWIDSINQLLPRIAAANTAVMVVDSASVLKNESGHLKPQYSIGDGIHLTKDAYREVLAYLRTHAYHLPMPLPITPDQWR